MNCFQLDAIWCDSWKWRRPLSGKALLIKKKRRKKKSQTRPILSLISGCRLRKTANSRSGLAGGRAAVELRTEKKRKKRKDEAAALWGMTSKPQIKLIWVFHFIFFLYFFFGLSSFSQCQDSSRHATNGQGAADWESHSSVSPLLRPPSIPPSLPRWHTPECFSSPKPITAPLAFGPSFCILEEASPAAAKWLTDGDETWGAPCLPANILIRNKNWFVEIFFLLFLHSEMEWMGGREDVTGPLLWFVCKWAAQKKLDFHVISQRIFFYYIFSFTQRRDGDSRFVGWCVHQACLLWFLFNTSLPAFFLIHVLLWRKTCKKIK